MLFFISKYRVLLLASAIVLWNCCAIGFIAPQSSWASGLFPEYPCIQKNIQFWEAIYSKYSTSQGVLHDSDDLSLIYTVIPLLDVQVTGATRINGDRIEEGKARIKEILLQLAAGHEPNTSEKQRIAALFPNKHPSVYAAAADNIRFQLGQKDRFREGVIRSGRFMPAFRKILSSHQLPLELAYLPHVESSFTPQAHSKAGAAGLWQLTRATGSDYLTINSLIDERYDPFIATDAAARLLKDNFAALYSWPLALTAYNYGRAGMLRAVKDKGNYEGIFQSYNQGYFKFAARNFYAEFLAAMRVARLLEQSTTLSLDTPEPLRTVRLQTTMSMHQLRLQTGLSLETLRHYNPALQKPVTEGSIPVPSGYLLTLPARNTLAQMTPPNAATSTKRDESPRSLVYIVQPGDTVSSIARKFQLPVKIVLAANNQKSTVQSGQKLHIPKNNTYM